MEKPATTLEPTPVIVDNKGKRDSAGKPRYDLIPPEFLEALAAHYAAGAMKYDERNWEKGMRWGECFRAVMSHAWKWWRGEKYDIDPKMPGYQCHHMVAAAWNCIAAYTYETRNIGIDDRNIVKENKIMWDNQNCYTENRDGIVFSVTKELYEDCLDIYKLDSIKELQKFIDIVTKEGVTQLTKCFHHKNMHIEFFLNKKLNPPEARFHIYRIDLERPYLSNLYFDDDNNVKRTETKKENI